MSEHVICWHCNEAIEPGSFGSECPRCNDQTMKELTSLRSRAERAERALEAERETAAVLRSQVENADATWAQQKACTDRERARAAAAERAREEAEARVGLLMREKFQSDRDWQAMCLLVATVAGEEDPEAAVADDYDPWAALRAMGDKHAASLAAAREALEGLVRRLEEVHADAAYQAVWQIAQLHVGPYRGLTYVDALARAAAVLGEGRR